MARSQYSLLSATALAKISSLDEENFRACSKELLSREFEPTLRTKALVGQFAEVFPDQDYAVALCSQLVAIATIRRVEAISDVQAYRDIANSLHFNGLPSEAHDWFVAVENQFVEMMRMRNVRLVAKALHLSTDFSDLFVSGNIVTDIRPVFENSREEVSGGLIVQTLRVQLISGSGRNSERELSLALDSDDIDKLILELQKAKKKSQAAREFVGKRLGDNAFIVGEDTYGFG